MPTENKPIHTCPTCGQGARLDEDNNTYIPTATRELMNLRLLKSAVLHDPESSATIMDIVRRMDNMK
jgi:hypothetical protein